MCTQARYHYSLGLLLTCMHTHIQYIDMHSVCRNTYLHQSQFGQLRFVESC